MWLRECREAGQQVHKFLYIKNTERKNLKDSYSPENLTLEAKGCGSLRQIARSGLQNKGRTMDSVIQ
jgi:hypothetical protein